MISLTPVQRQVFDYISEHLETTGTSPSYREIAAGCGFATISRIGEIMDALVERGWLARIPGKWRTLTVVHRMPGPAELRRLTVRELDQLIAQAAGVRAHKEGGNPDTTRAVLRRIADTLPPAGRAG